MQMLNAPVVLNSPISDSIMEMVVYAPEVASTATPGQFVNVYPDDGVSLLPRPISIADVDVTRGTITLIYAIVGVGTRAFSNLAANASIRLMGPLGNGYSVPNTIRKPLLVAGGVGTPPMIFLARTLRTPVTVYLGFRTKPYLIDRLSAFGEVKVATDDGSVGFRGNVIDLMEHDRATGDMAFACGPRPMLQGVQKWARMHCVPAQLSLEERMGCGIGTCVGCVVKIKDSNEQGWIYRKVCHDGPVFPAEEVLFQ